MAPKWNFSAIRKNAIFGGSLVKVKGKVNSAKNKVNVLALSRCAGLIETHPHRISAVIAAKSAILMQILILHDILLID